MARTKNLLSAVSTVVLAMVTGCVTETGDKVGDEVSEEEVADDEVTESVSALTTTPVYPSNHPRIYLGPNKARLTTALDSNTPAAAAFRSKVDAWYAGTSIWGFQAWNGALMSQISGNLKYCTKAVAVVETQVKAAETKIAVNAAPEVAGDSYLQIGEMIGDLAIVYDWCFAQTTSTQRARWIKYANQAISNVWNHTTAKWGTATIPWSGWSVNNPSNNYYYSFLRATMLVGLATRGENTQADAWLTKFRDEKIVNQLVPTFNADLVNGASREGTGYGVAMRRLFELYDWWKATTGETLASATPHTRKSMLAFIHQTMPTLDKVAPVGDHSRDATAAFFDYHRDYLQELMQIFPADSLSRRAKYLLTNSNTKTMSQSFMVGYDFINDNPGITTTALTGLNTTYHGKGIGAVYARSGWDKAATWVNLIAGPYTESHAHQDQGSLMIYKGGWLAHDANIHSRSGLAQETTAHSLVRIDSGGVPIKQVAATVSKVVALKKGTGYVYLSTDVTPSYRGHAAIQKVHREMLYLEPNAIIVFDRVQTTSGTTQTWQLVSPTAAVTSGNTATITNAGHTLKVTRMAPSSATVSNYAFASNTAFTGGYRLDEKVAGGDQRYLHVLSVDGAVTSQTSAGTTAQPGVTVNLSTGKQVTIKFNRDTVGGSLTIDGVTTTLVAGVQTLSEGQ